MCVIIFELIQNLNFVATMLINSSLFSWQYLDGYTAKAAIHKAKANCGERNVQNLAKATGRKRKRAPPPNSNKKMQKGRRKSFNLHPDQTESKAVDDLGLTRERHDAFKKATLMLRDSQLARERAGGRRPRGCKMQRPSSRSPLFLLTPPRQRIKSMSYP